MDEVSHKELRFHRIMAALRENYFPEGELKYIGEIDGEHTFLIAGEHIVKLDDIVDFEQVDDSESDTV